jgi:uncharacterized phage protein (TIGR02220 family)
MVYILTNPLANTLGCYEISKREMAFHTGYNTDTIDKLIDRFQNVHKIIRYDYQNRELLIENWSKYNWLVSDKTLTRIVLELQQLKSPTFKELLTNRLEVFYKKDIKKMIKNDGAYMGHGRGSYAEQEQEHNKNINNNITKHNKKIMSSDEHSTTLPFEKIISFLNSKAKTNFKYTTEKTKECIKARFNEGWKEEDFYKVIEIKVSEWLGTDQQIYLRPITLFGTKFESYLNQKSPVKSDSVKKGGVDSATTF